MTTMKKDTTTTGVTVGGWGEWNASHYNIIFKCFWST
jgi:hypothetical protein